MPPRCLVASSSWGRRGVRRLWQRCSGWAAGGWGRNSLTKVVSPGGGIRNNIPPGEKHGACEQARNGHRTWLGFIAPRDHLLRRIKAVPRGCVHDPGLSEFKSPFQGVHDGEGGSGPVPAAARRTAVITTRVVRARQKARESTGGRLLSPMHCFLYVLKKSERLVLF